MEKDIGKVEEIVKSLFSRFASEQRVTMIQSIQPVLNSEFIRTSYEIPDMCLFRKGKLKLSIWMTYRPQTV